MANQATDSANSVNVSAIDVEIMIGIGLRTTWMMATESFHIVTGHYMENNLLILICLLFRCSCAQRIVFPAYLVDQHLPATVGTTVLALIGLFNIFGTYTAGWLGGRMSKPRLLTGLYLLRAVVIGLFLWAPVTTTSAYLFGMAMGFLWLSTVPLTNGTVATLFGVRNLSMLGGIVFLFHQLGSFLGGWLGGVVYDRTGSYDLIWQVAILLSLMAAALNWPVRERPVARLQSQLSAT